MFNSLGMKYILYTLLIIFYSNIILISQEFEKEVLVRIGENVISKDEFQNRLNFYPTEGIQDKNSNEGIKKELLYTLIAEKLWVNHALETGYDKNPSVIAAKSVIEKMFVRDELYKTEIKNGILISDDELDSAIAKNNIILNCLVFFHNEEKILRESFFSFISKNNVDSLEKLASVSNILTKNLKISYGDLPQNIENVLYGLEPGEYSEPFNFDEGWNIFYLIDKTERIYNDNKERLESRKSVNKILSRRIEDKRYSDFYDKFFANLKVNVDGKLFNIISEKLSEIFSDKYSKGIYLKDKNDQDLILLDTEDLRLLESNLESDILSKTFIEFQVEPIDLITFLREISFQSFSVNSSDFNEIKVSLNKKIKEYIKYELLSREGYKRGLDQMPLVKYWVKIWYENFLYQAIRNNHLKNSENELNSVLFQGNDQKDLKKHNSESSYIKFVEKTMELSDEYEIIINEEMYNSISQGNINFFVLRNLGFGGRIAGVPSSPIFIDWYLEKQKRDLQNL